jgi:hypothetical protein
MVTAKAVGGTAPYTFTWSTGQTATSTSSSQVSEPVFTTVTVTVVDAVGATKTSSVYVDGTCSGGGGVR